MSPGRKPEPLARLHRRSGQDDPVDLVGLQGLHAQGHGQVRLARAGRADAEGDDVVRRWRRCSASGPPSSGRTVRPRAERSTSVVRTSAGLTSSFTMAMVRPMSEASRRWPCSSSTTSSSKSRPTRSASSPSMRDLVAPGHDADAGEGLLDQAQQFVSFAEQAHHEVVAGNEDLDRGGAHPGGQAMAPAAEDVEVEMGHGVGGVLAHVEHEPVAALGDALVLGHRRAATTMSARTSASVVLDGGGVVDVAAGDDEDVHRRLGVQVAEGHGVVGPCDDVGGEVPGDDAAEDAVPGAACRSPRHSGPPRRAGAGPGPFSSG